MKTKVTKIEAAHTWIQAAGSVSQRQIDEYRIEDDRTIQTRVGWNVRMILNAVNTEGDV